MNFIRVMQDSIYINCHRRVLIYLTAALCAAVFAASPSVALTRSEDGFYLIATAAELAEFRDMVNEGNDDISARLTADIDLSKNGELSEWKPIGNPSFNGTFDGGGHTVSGYVVKEAVRVQMTTSAYVDYAGFFARIEMNGSVSNLLLIGDTDVTSDVGLRAGGVSGAIEELSKQSGIIFNCVHKGKVSAKVENASSYAGGITGYNNGLIVNCFHSGDVFATRNNNNYENAGGIAGMSDNTLAIYNSSWRSGENSGEGYAFRGVGYGEQIIDELDYNVSETDITTSFMVSTSTNMISIDGEPVEITFSPLPGSPKNMQASDCILNPYLVVGSYDENIIDVLCNDKGSFMLIPQSIGKTPITFRATLCPINFDTPTEFIPATDDKLVQELSATINVEVTETPTTPPAAGNGGGCSAGFGVPAFAALAVLILVRKRI